MRYSNHPKFEADHSCLPKAARVGLFILFGALSLGIIVSCNQPAGLESTGLTIAISASTPRTLVPNIDMNAVSYAIAGTGPSGATFSTTLASGTSTTITTVTAGTWTVNATGKNAAGTSITYGSATAQVTTGATATVNITATPIVGPGSLNLTVTWPVASVTSPSIKAQLLPATGSTIPLTFSVNSSTGSASYSGSGIQNGYYTLTLQLFDGSNLVMGAVEVAEIIQGQTTSGTYNFTVVNDPKLQVNITPNPLNPLTVTMSGAPTTPTVAPGSPVALSASVPAGTGNVTYAWYVNGVSQALGTASSFTLNSSTSPLAVGTYRVDVTVFTANGLQAGSATTTITVQ